MNKRMNKRMLSVAAFFLFAAMSMSVRAQEPVKDSLDYANEMLKAGVNAFQTDYMKGREFFNVALPFADSSLSVTICRYLGLSWYQEATDKMDVSGFAEAESALDSSLVWYRKAGEQAWAVSSLTLLSYLKEHRWDLDGALECLDTAYAKLQPGMDTETLDIIKNKYAIYAKYGMVDRITPMFVQVDSLMRATTDTMTKVECGVILADNALNAGHASQAETLYRESLRTLDNSGHDNELYAVLGKLRHLSMSRKEFGDALDCSQRMLDILKAGGNQDLGLAYFNIAEVYEKSLDTARCLSYADSIMANGGVPMKDPILNARHLMLKGMLNGRLGRWNNAADIYASVDSAMAAVGQNALRERMNLVPLRAAALYQAGRLSESEALYSDYYEYCGKVYSEESDATTTALLNLANIRAYSGKIEEGSSDYMEVERRLTRKITERLRFLPSETRDHYLDDMLKVTFAMTAFGLKAKHTGDAFSDSAWEALLLSKGLLLSSEIDASDKIRRDGTSEDKALFYRLMGMQRNLAAMESRAGVDHAASAALCGDLLVADAKLAVQSSAYRETGEFLNIGASMIKNSLDNNDVIVDMADFKSDDGTHPYTAYIIRKGYGHAELVRLCENVEIGSDFSETLSSPEVKTMIDRLSSYLNPGDDLYFVPSGHFHLIPIESFPMPDGRCFGDVYNVVRLSSARDLVAIKQNVKSAGKHLTASLFGNLDYGDAHSSLPATESELKDIARTLKKHSVTEYSGSQGTRDAFLALDGKSTDVIHLATHGFYYEPEDGENKSSVYRKTMNMSGLVMSGGQRLTAAEIAAMDLSGTSLVCLSACETGLGHVTPEGIYGLQRAFKKAGVCHILVNVGEASDVASSLFMTEFYRALVRGGNDMHDAFRKARSAVRKRYPDPYYWAGFMLLD
mgnify:FL=1